MAKPAPVAIGQLQASAPQLMAQDTILFNEIALAPGGPATQ